MREMLDTGRHILEYSCTTLIINVTISIITTIIVIIMIIIINTY